MDMARLVCETSARLYPDKPALVDGTDRYTFEELDRLSGHFGRFLLSRGLMRGDRVAFLSHKSASSVLAILGCLKAGAIYVPLDPRAPRDRLALILKDLVPRVVVSRGDLFPELAGDLGSSALLIDEGRLQELHRGSGDGPSFPDVNPDDVAYCIYTSGSTGVPKGVLIRHGSVDAFFRALGEVMHVDGNSICMNTSELCFDVHIMDVFFPLHRGATVHLSRGATVANALLRTIEEERVTHFTAVGPIMTLMAGGSSFGDSDLSSLRQVMTGAEIINIGTMQKWLRKVPGLTLINGYGPTEATVICACYVIDREEPDRSEFYPIGRPMAGTEVLLLDGDKPMTEPLVNGELLISGPQLMKGYWNDPRFTEEKTIHIDGRRYYKSGDVCRWLPDGNLDYVGRVDEEVKLSGFRINLNEIKRVLDSTLCVKEGHPLVLNHPTLGKVIAACFTPAGGELPDDVLFRALNQAMKDALPYYMVPSLYFLFERFPQLASGKTDKKGMQHLADQLVRRRPNGVTRFVCSQRPRADQ